MQNEEDEGEESKQSEIGATFSPIPTVEPAQDADAEMEEEQSYNSYHEDLND
jgi:hypothetical protein